jgi:hypothetical protein
LTITGAGIAGIDTGAARFLDGKFSAGCRQLGPAMSAIKIEGDAILSSE